MKNYEFYYAGNRQKEESPRKDKFRMAQQYDKIIIGAGLYGLYAAAFCGARDQHVLVLEYDDAPFKRATYINQARVHMGYHYPRSLTTAVKSAGYFKRFVEDLVFAFTINLIRSMLRLKSFRGPVQNNFRTSARQLRLGVTKLLFPDILKMECARVHF